MGRLRQLTLLRFGKTKPRNSNLRRWESLLERKSVALSRSLGAITLKVKKRTREKLILPDQTKAEPQFSRGALT
jgi:hypothetical protein